MKRILIYSSVLAAMALPVPWIKLGTSEGPAFFGLPAWAFYAIIASVVYAGFIAFMLGRFWDWSAGEGDHEP